MQELGIDPTDSIYRPVVSRVSGFVANRAQTEPVIAVARVAWRNSLALHHPQGLSLPTNEEFELQLKALSPRLAGNHLVTTVIQCSEFYEVDCEGRRMDEGGSSMGSDRSTDSDTFTSLCTIGIPLAWRREPACAQRREQFKNIREHFYALANLHHLVDTESRHKSADIWETSGMVDLSAMFGLEHLEIFVGEITFFEHLPSMMEAQMRVKGSVGTTRGNRSSVQPSNPSFNSCREVVAPILLNKCEILGQLTIDKVFLREKQHTQHEVESISQTLSVGLLDHICTAFLDASKRKP
ncbi:hypothetical protein M404DRAFT_505804 [Pisolithus tinctorius Marx 270]|uniref:Uncharacterized protein n=1 Tax=Pisolithus tinctorius Marx 270 TaxID=870435 RepID=A0A0C3PCU8_PISTI|nr:hypothetical protein M404DRAFT_505804 [Pisolithus tinctorius Marx 270]